MVDRELPSAKLAARAVNIVAGRNEDRTTHTAEGLRSLQVQSDREPHSTPPLRYPVRQPREPVEPGLLGFLKSGERTVAETSVLNAPYVVLAYRLEL
jgi:hypothetical protein